MFWKVLGALVAVWLVITVAGWLIKGLLWLALVAGVVVLATAAIGWARKGMKQLK